MRRGKIRTCCILIGMISCILYGCGSVETANDENASGKSTEESDFPSRIQNGEGSVAAAQEENELLYQNLTQETKPFFEEDSADHYAFDSLTAQEQLWYCDINRTLGDMLSGKELAEEGLDSGMDETDIDRIFQYVLNDHPEYFYVEGYTYTKYMRLKQLVKLEFSGTYSCSLKEAESRRMQINMEAEQLMAGISEEASDYDKAKYVYETIIRNTEYSLDSADNQNIYSVFHNRVSVCQGYAKATQFMLNRLGVPCTVIMGTVDTGEGHVWNLAKLDGQYYYIDATWGDASYQTGGEGASVMPQINYDYLCITTEQLLKTHTPDNTVPLPVCDSMEDNYYVREGAYFTSFDEERLHRLFADAVQKGQTDVTLKASDHAVYEEIKEKLIDGQEIFEYMETNGATVAYARNEKQLSLTFWVTK